MGTAEILTHHCNNLDHLSGPPTSNAQLTKDNYSSMKVKDLYRGGLYRTYIRTLGTLKNRHVKSLSVCSRSSSTIDRNVVILCAPHQVL
jgi:hypothetical protein